MWFVRADLGLVFGPPNAYRAQVDMHWGWYIVLLGAVAVLIAVLVRRLKRTLAALRGEHPARGGRPDRN